METENLIFSLPRKGEILSIREWTQSIFELEISIEGDNHRGIEKLPRPGQFFMLYPDDSITHLLGRPLSVHRAGIIGDRLALGFLVEEVGWGTRKMHSLPKGSQIRIMGPLGRGYKGEFERPLLVAGGMGIAPLYYLAQELDGRGIGYTLMAGYSSSEKVCPDLDTISGKVEIFTEDGKVGRKGLVSEGVRGLLEGEKHDAVCVCGPTSMMSEVSRIALGFGLPCQVSLAQRMGCGMGLCRSCVSRGEGGQNLSVCRDGPVFDAREISWQLLESSSIDICREA